MEKIGNWVTGKLGQRVPLSVQIYSSFEQVFGDGETYEVVLAHTLGTFPALVTWTGSRQGPQPLQHGQVLHLTAIIDDRGYSPVTFRGEKLTMLTGVQVVDPSKIDEEENLLRAAEDANCCPGEGFDEEDVRGMVLRKEMRPGGLRNRKVGLVLRAAVAAGKVHKFLPGMEEHEQCMAQRDERLFSLYEELTNLTRSRFYEDAARLAEMIRTRLVRLQECNEGKRPIYQIPEVETPDMQGPECEV